MAAMKFLDWQLIGPLENLPDIQHSKPQNRPPR